MAEDERFELSVQVSPYVQLATEWFKPLTQSSSPFAIMKNND